jgi:hypothetical protein
MNLTSIIVNWIYLIYNKIITCNSQNKFTDLWL